MKVLLCLAALVAVACAQQYGSQQYRQPQPPRAQQYRPVVPQQKQYTAPQQYKPQPQQQYTASKNVVPITAYSNEVSPDGSYSYSYQSGDGTSAQESGYLKQVGAEQAQTVQGSYSYTAPDGTPITVTYVADENGYRAEGAHLPTPPPIPAVIQRSLDFIASQQGRQQPQQQYKPQQPTQYKPQQYQQQQYKQRF